MIATTVNAIDAWLLTQGPNTEAAVRLEVEIPVGDTRGLTGYSSRRPGALLPRFRLGWTALLTAAQFAAMRDASMLAQDEPILAPIWDHAYRPATETASLEGGLTLAWTEGFATWEINPASLAGFDWAAPLVFGRWASPPRVVARSGVLLQVSIDLVEESPAGYAIAPADGILAADTTAGGYPIFPFAAQADWSRAQSPGLGVVDVERLAIGPGRVKATIFYPQLPERICQAAFLGTGRTWSAQLIAWWIRRGGIADAHWLPLEDMGITDGETIRVRHTNRSLALETIGPITRCELAWRETAPEGAEQEGETEGTTFGRLPAEAWFFEIALDFQGVTQTWRFTNWESGADGVGGEDWDYNACDFDRLTQSIDMEDEECVCTFRYFEDGPWDHWLPGRLAARGTLSVYRANVSATGVFSGFAQLWSGELRKPATEGPIVTWHSAANAFMGRLGPRQLMSPTCGTMLFRPRCGIAEADWTWNAEINSSAGATVTIDTLARANSAGNPAGFGGLNWFALGALGWTEAGQPRRVMVLGSTALSGGAITLTLDRAPGLANGTAVTVVPGCDRLRAGGCTKFSNTDNFRGFDQMPAISPSFVMPQRQFSSAKK